jgi:hypothetical protein
MALLYSIECGKLSMAITGHVTLIDLQCKSLKTVAWPVATASFTTVVIIIIPTKARSYKHWTYSYKIVHAKKVELEYLADLWLCARCLVFKLYFSYLLNRRLRGCLHDGRWDDFRASERGGRRNTRGPECLERPGNLGKKFVLFIIALCLS